MKVICTMQEVKDWIDNTSRSYADGVRLYERYGQFQWVKIILRKGENELTKEKLWQLMTDLWADYTKAVEQKKQSAETPTAAKEELKLTPPSQYLIEIDEKWKKAYAEMAVMHSRLIMAQTDEARYALAYHITQLEDTCIDLWKKRDYYEEHGQPVPEKKKRYAKKDINNFELRKLLSARSALSSYKNVHLPKALAQHTAKPSKKTQKRVERMYASIKRYEDIIKQFDL